VSDTYVISVGDAVTVDLTGLQYPYVGDLRATLTLQNSLNQVLATGDIFNQIGAYNPGDPGDQGQFGNSGSIDSGNYSFNSSYTADIWNAACCQGSSDSLPSGSYYTTTALSDNNDELSSMFAGQAVTGTWVLTIYDYYPPFNGIYPFPYNPSIGSWSLDITTTPEPSMIILTALAGVLLWGIRRRAVNSR
jgi:hypothetical protein